MLSKNSVQCVSNLYVSPPVFSTFSLPPLMMISFSFWPRSNSNSLGGLKNFQFSNVFVLYSSSHAFPPGGTILRIIATPKQYLVNFFKMLRSLSPSLGTVVDEHEIKLEFRVQVISLSANPEQGKLVTSKKYIVLRPQNYLRHFLKLPFFPHSVGEKSKPDISFVSRSRSKRRNEETRK